MRAVLVKPDGTRIEVEGTEEEIRRLWASAYASSTRPDVPFTVTLQPAGLGGWWFTRDRDPRDT